MRDALRIFLIAAMLPVFISSSLLASDPASSTKEELLLKLRRNADAEALGVLESYNESVELEKEIAQMYREIRAARLSQIQGQSLVKSLEQTLLPISSRIVPDEKILNMTARSGDDVTQYQEELQRVMQENDAIVANADEMLRSLLPEMKEEPSEESNDLPELSDKEMEAVEQESDQQQSSEEMKERIQQLEKEAQEKIEETRESLDDAHKEMTQAEEIVKQKPEPEPEQENKAEPEPQPEPRPEQETKPEPQPEVKPEEPLPETTEKLEDAKALIETAQAVAAEEKEELQEKVEQAEKVLEKIAEALDASVEADDRLKEEKREEPQAHTEKAVEYLQDAKADMEAAAQALELAAKLMKAMSKSGQDSKAQEIAQQQALAVLSQAAAGNYLDLTKQMKGEDFSIEPEPVRPEELPPPISKYFKDISGRKLVSSDGTPAVWFNVNQWYLLGPYDNNGRMNIQRVYPPESIVDLDAHYLGKGGAKLSWAYDSFGEEMVNPSTGWGEYSIYYGYTELYFEEATDAWIAVGSDDRSDLWINDMPVWQSSNKLKGWRVDEGYRKVHFKKGANKLLFRLENGWHGMGFSLLVNTCNPEKSK